MRQKLSDWRGYCYGVAAALIWGGQLAMSRAGVTTGLDGLDVTALRCGAAGVVMLPWFLARRRYGNGPGRTRWSHTLWLALAAGPLFVSASMLGFRFAPLPHGAVLQPSAMVLTAMGLSALLLGERLRPLRLVGAVVIIAGLGLIAGPAVLLGDRLTPIGDLLFIVAGGLFALYSVLQKLWLVPPMQATGAVTVIAGALFLPPYLAFWGVGHLVALSWHMLLAQMLVQGVLTGVVSLIAFGRAIQLLGAARASLFPALVPCAAIIVGIPLVGEWPNLMQTAGLAVVTAGLMVALSAGTGKRQPTPAPVSRPR